MKRLLNIVVILLLLSAYGCINMELHNLKKCPSIPACCHLLNSHLDDKDYQEVLQLYDGLWENAKYQLKNSGVDSSAISYLEELVDYMYANKKYVIRLEIDSAIDVKSVNEYDFDVKAFYEILNK